ncbi:MAG: ABC transporter permease [Candidatus Velthaea sp.]
MSADVASLDLATAARAPQRARDARAFAVPAVQLGVLAAIVALWQIGANTHYINGTLFGSPAGIAASALRTWNDGSLVTDSALTLWEAVAGFVLGTLLGSAGGLGLWYAPFLARVVEPAAVALNGVPKIAMGPLIIIWLGAGVASKIVLAFVSTAVVAFLAAYAAAREVDPDLVTSLRSMGATRVQTFRTLLVPGSLPLMFSAMRINVGFALVGAVVGEFIASAHGLGHAVFVAGNLFDLNTVWLGIIVLSLIAAVMYAALGAAERALVKGRP